MTDQELAKESRRALVQLILFDDPLPVHVVKHLHGAWPYFGAVSGVPDVTGPTLRELLG